MENRRLSREHTPLMADLLKKGFPVSDWSQNDLDRFLLLESSHAWGCFLEGELISFCLIQKVAEEAEILLLVVHPEVRKKGMGRSLLETIVTEVKGDTVSRLFLEVSVENETAIQFYNKLGFQRVGIRKNYYMKKANPAAYTMVKFLHS